MTSEASTTDAESAVSLGSPGVRRTIYGAVGALQGGLLHVLVEYGGTLTGSDTLRFALTYWLVFSPTLYLLAEEEGRRVPAAIVSGTFGLAVAGLFLAVDARFEGTAPGEQIAVFAMAAIVLAHVGLPFYRCWSESGAVVEALETGEVEIVALSHRTIRAGGVELPVTPWR